MLFFGKKRVYFLSIEYSCFFIHSYFAQEITSNSLISVVNHKVSYFFSRSITQFAVPMFFMMSGITFFKDYSDKKYLAKIKARLFTLVIPYLLWNTIWMLWEIFTSYSFIAKFSTDSAPYPLTFSRNLLPQFMQH